MPIYISEEELKTQIVESGVLPHDTRKAFYVFLKDIPAANAQEVVMCKDCKFRFMETCFAKHETAENDFCSNGLRMDGDKE